MKIRTLILICMSGLILSFAYEYSRAEVKPAGDDLKIGIISIRKIFENSKKHADYKQKANEEQDKMVAELDSLSKQIDAEKAGLKTLKPDSNDYMNLVKSLLEKQAKSQAQEEFYKKQLTLKHQRWTEKIYEEILKITEQIAAEKGLKLVLEKDTIDLPAENANDLMEAIRTNKVLYSGGCPDITEDVIAKLDSGN